MTYPILFQISGIRLLGAIGTSDIYTAHCFSLHSVTSSTQVFDLIELIQIHTFL